MISRTTARILGEAYQLTFTLAKLHNSVRHIYVDKDQLYDFLFDRDYAPWICNAATGYLWIGRTGTDEKVEVERVLKMFVMQFHTGESLIKVTPDWDWERRKTLGQRYLRDLAKDIIPYLEKAHGINRTRTADYGEAVLALRRSLELDGYIYRDGILLFSESDVLDIAEETGVLQSLFTRLGLGNIDTFKHHMELSEKHYLSGLWTDVISNSRKVFECCLQEAAATHSLKVRNSPLSNDTYTRPVRVRDYLETEGLLEKKEKETVAQVYGLLSETGGHPYVAQKDQARLLRQIALTFSQFVLLRLEGRLNKPTP